MAVDPLTDQPRQQQLLQVHFGVERQRQGEPDRHSCLGSALSDRLFPRPGLDAVQGLVVGAAAQVAQVVLGRLDKEPGAATGKGLHSARDLPDGDLREDWGVQVRRKRGLSSVGTIDYSISLPSFQRPLLRQAPKVHQARTGLCQFHANGLVLPGKGGVRQELRQVRVRLSGGGAGRAQAEHDQAQEPGADAVQDQGPVQEDDEAPGLDGRLQERRAPDELPRHRVGVLQGAARLPCAEYQLEGLRSLVELTTATQAVRIEVGGGRIVVRRGIGMGMELLRGKGQTTKGRMKSRICEIGIWRGIRLENAELPPGVTKLPYIYTFVE